MNPILTEYNIKENTTNVVLTKQYRICQSNQGNKLFELNGYKGCNTNVLIIYDTSIKVDTLNHLTQGGEIKLDNITLKVDNFTTVIKVRRLSEFNRLIERLQEWED
jgi:hypothetical protein